MADAEPTAVRSHFPACEVLAREHRFHLLLVDDEPCLLDALALLLAPLGHPLARAESGAEAIAALGREHHDLVLLDLRMPGLDGNAVMDFIRARQLPTKVIVVTGDWGIEAAVGALKRGAHDFLRKPYRPDELLRTVEDAIELCRRQREARQHEQRLQCSEMLYRTLVDHSPDVIYTVGSDGTVTFLNGHGQRLLRDGGDGVVGRPVSELIHDDDVALAHYVLGECLAANHSIRDVELRFKGLAGEAERIFEHTLTQVNPASDRGDAALPGELGGVYAVARDVTERKKAHQAIARHAHHDLLTGLPNRLLFNDRLGHAIAQAQRSRSAVGVMFVDLDGFKRVNDSLGHVYGDELLQQVAGRLKKVLRSSDTLARQGGDEFTIVLPDLPDARTAAIVAEKAVAAIRRPFHLGSHEVRISACLGVAVYPEHGETIELLLRHADMAMYQVKAQGKNGFRFYDSSMRDASHKKMAFERSLRSAIASDELEMYYQPQVDVRDGRIVGAEALMRWNHPTRGLLAAADFLPFAEDNGLMVPIGEWALDALGRDVRRWNAVGGERVRLSLNLSAQSLDRGQFVDQLRAALDRHGVAASQIEIEIPENLCIANPEHAASQLNKLSRLGVTVAIDDFGTGYSSLAYLHRFPIHTIKIDQSFVGEIRRDNGHFPVVRAIISMASGLGLKLVAEGVESEVQARYLRHSGCTTMQGYLFHRPLPAGELIEVLRERARA